MTVAYTNQKIEAALRLLAEFKTTSFPHTDSTSAVDILISILNVTKAFFSTPSSSAVTRQMEMEATALISEILELLGVISNSANVRNSFEIHGPVLHLAKKLLGDQKANLVISFEWNYIPYTYPQNHPHLPSFVIIGLPASEASNALVLPAIGHELGHSLWRRDNCRSYFEPNITKEIVSAIKGTFKSDYNRIYSSLNITADQCDDYRNLWTWDEAADYCFRQVEEIFSDFTGLALFGTSYLDSFEYLLSPSLSTERSPEYPSVERRAQYLEVHAPLLNVATRPNFTSEFVKQVSPFHVASISELQMSVADAASDALVQSIAHHVLGLMNSRKLSPPDDAETNSIVSRFLKGVPAEHTTGVGAIINAGWAVLKSAHFMARFDNAERMKTINELVLKSIEIFEIERMISNGSQKKHP